MKKNILLLTILCLSFSALAQRTNYMLLRNLENGKQFKLMYDRKYEVKLKPNFINTLPKPFAAMHEEEEGIILKLTNANWDTLFFQNNLAIPYRFIESMSERDVSFYVNSTFIGIDLVALGLINYFMFQQNPELYEIIFTNIFTGVFPLGIVLPASLSHDYVILNKYGIESLEQKDIFKKQTKTIFDK